MRLNLKKFWNEYLSQYNHSFILIVIAVLLYETAVVLFIPLDSPLHGDERHFVETINYFSDFNLQKIRDYKEVTPPFTYLVYAAWGKLAGFELHNLRLLSLLIAVAVYLFLHRLFFLTLDIKQSALLLTLFFMINPYVVGFNIFIFTDMLTILFIILFCIAVKKNNKTLLFVSALLALLSRQYAIYIVLAAGVYYMFSYPIKKDKTLILNIFLLGLSVIPLLVLFLVWNGFAPESGLNYWSPGIKTHFNLNYLSTYMVMMVLYTLPLILYRWKYFYNWKLFLILIVPGLFYFLFPVTPSAVTLEQTELTTVGVLHKFIRSVIPSGAVEHILFFLAFILGIGFIAKIIKDIADQIKEKIIGFGFFADFSIILFLLVMPFSYQVWEKYLLIVLPLIFIRILNEFKESVLSDMKSASL